VLQSDVLQHTLYLVKLASPLVFGIVVFILLVRFFRRRWLIHKFQKTGRMILWIDKEIAAHEGALSALRDEKERQLQLQAEYDAKAHHGKKRPQANK
jgi:hypothetical protein